VPLAFLATGALLDRGAVMLTAAVPAAALERGGSLMYRPAVMPTAYHTPPPARTPKVDGDTLPRASVPRLRPPLKRVGAAVHTA
jgi:hypothetical protein